MLLLAVTDVESECVGQRAGHSLLTVPATEIFGVTERHALRILAAHRKEDPAAIAHGNRGRQPPNAVSDDLAAAVNLGGTHCECSRRSRQPQRVVHLWPGWPGPTPQPQRQAKPLNAEPLGTTQAADRRGRVDVAICAVLRDGLLRRSEAADLRW